MKQKPFMKNMKLVATNPEVEANTTTESGGQPPQLSEDTLRVLLTIESQAQEFINVDLPKARKAAQEAQENLFRVESAITTAEVMIGRELQKAGVSIQTYLAQKKEYLEQSGK